MNMENRIGLIISRPLEAVTAIGIGMATFVGIVSISESARATYHFYTDTVDVKRKVPGHLFKKEIVTVRCFDGKIM